ncbi:MAG: hypothetical protein Q8P56_05400 [Candidatus Uhrbacteria bacterium]|nr:hypothetical protein [Candidatus Uhrbacteria bacterium]
MGKMSIFSRPFFEQYFEMVKKTPKSNLTLLKCENVDYCNNMYASRNCYLSFNSVACEDCYYCLRGTENRDCAYVHSSQKCELCYMCANCRECYNVQFSEFSTHCTNSRFLSNCVDCSDCYQCANLKYKQYYIRNTQYTKEEYECRMANIDLLSHGTLQKEQEEWKNFLHTQPMQAERNVNCEDSSGVLLTNCTSCVSCFYMNGGENCFSSWGSKQAENCDSSGDLGAEYGVMNMGYVNSKHCAYNILIENSYDLFYSQYITQSHDCFGCYGLKKSQYCILNKQYSEEEYGVLKEKLIEHMKKTGEWGQNFPPRYSFFPYSETLADVSMSILFDHREDVIERMGLRRNANGSPLLPSPQDLVPGDQIPDSLDQFSDKLLEITFSCEKTQRKFKITKKELELYRRFRVAVPRKAWRTTFEEWYPLLQPLPNQAMCSRCGKDIYCYIHPNKTDRQLFCDKCFLEATS